MKKTLILLTALFRFIKNLFSKKESQYNIYNKPKPYYKCDKKYYSKNRYIKAPAIMFFILSLSLIGCGTIKKDKQQTDIKTEIDSTKKTTSETNTEGSKETKINYKANTFTFTPFDAGTPYFVDGKEYKGGTLVIKNESKDETIMEQLKQQNKLLIEQNARFEQEIEEIKKNKETDNTAVYDSFFRYFFLFLLIAILVAMWYVSKRLPKFEKV